MGIWENAIAFAVNKALDEKQKEFQLILEKEKRKAEEKEKLLEEEKRKVQERLVFTLRELGLSIEQIVEKSQLSIEQVQNILRSKT